MLLVGRKHDNEKSRTNFCNTVTFQPLGKNEDIFFLLLVLTDKWTENYFSNSKNLAEMNSLYSTANTCCHIWAERAREHRYKDVALHNMHIIGNTAFLMQYKHIYALLIHVLFLFVI